MLVSGRVIVLEMSFSPTKTSGFTPRPSNANYFAVPYTGDSRKHLSAQDHVCGLSFPPRRHNSRLSHKLELSTVGVAVFVGEASQKNQNSF